MVDAVVAPHVGAWIEMYPNIGLSSCLLVAPHVGAWIEIKSPFGENKLKPVAPHVGAWIEIEDRDRALSALASLPMWERGLKLLSCGSIHK